jgi:hypothetical protein
LARKKFGFTRREFLNVSGIQSRVLDVLQDLGFMNLIRPEERLEKERCYSPEEVDFIWALFDYLDGSNTLYAACCKARAALLE